jgi:hypothetical protein
MFKLNKNLLIITANFKPTHCEAGKSVSHAFVNNNTLNFIKNKPNIQFYGDDLDIDKKYY